MTTATDPVTKVCIRGLLPAALLVLSIGTERAHADYLPSVQIGTAPLVSTNDASTYYGGGTSHGDSLADAPLSITTTGNERCTSNPATSPRCPPEIREMARALKNNVDLIYEYVRNNVETVWTFGSTKGALGALIDKSGTPFDQAMLMVELLRAAGYSATTATYEYGKIAPSASAFLDATGIQSATAACQLLASGGIPGKVNSQNNATCSFGSAALGEIQFMHVWVKVTISGTDYRFDPSFKPYTWKTGVSLASVTGMSSGSPLSQASSGMGTGTTSSVPYVQNLNSESLNSTLASYSTALLNHINTNLPAAALEDVIGGGTITPYYSPTGGLRQTQHPLASGTPTGWADIPNQFRTTLTVSATRDNTGTPSTVTVFGATTFYVDDIYGRPLTIDTSYKQGEFNGTSVSAYLKLDGVTIASSANGTLTPRYSTHLTLAVNHPYAANSGTYMDVTAEKTVILVTGLTIVHGWGDSRGLFAKWSEELAADSMMPGRTHPATCEGGDGGGAPCPPPYYVSPTGDVTRMKAAASWLMQFSHASNMHAAIAKSTFQMHHAIGAVYADVNVKYAYGDCNVQTCEYDLVVGDSTTQLDIDAGISLTSKTVDATTRRAALHAIAATGAALEGSVAAEMTDLVDTSSTATRFEWGNRPPSSEDPSSAGPRRFFQFSTSPTSTQLNAIVQFEGTATPASPTGICINGGAVQDGPLAFATGYWMPNLRKAIGDYAVAGFTVTAGAESLLGPGQRNGDFWHGPNVPSQVTDCAPTRQRGGALVATKYDGNGDPTEIAHVIVQFDANSKGGGAGTPPDHGQNYDPATAADILKTRFVDRSIAMGVSLQNGTSSFTSPVGLTVGNGGFPYELSASLTWHTGPLDAGFGPPSPTQPRTGWVTNWHNALVLSGSGMEAMGKSDVRAAIGAIVSFLVAQDIYKGSVSAQREVAANLVNAWWMHQITRNVATVSLGAGSRQFVRLFNNSWISPGASAYATMAQTGTSVPFEETCTGQNGPYALSRGWNDNSVSFKITNANGDEQNFVHWVNNYRTVDTSVCGKLRGFRLNTWVFPYGVTVTVDYGNGYDPNGGPGIDRITGVHNDRGRSITFNYTGGSWFPTAIRNGTSTTGQVTFDSLYNGFIDKHTDALNNATRYEILLPQVRTLSQRPVISARIARVYTPDNPNVANVEYTYDTLGRVKEAKDAVALQQGGRNPYQFLIADGTRGERIDPLGQSYIVTYDTEGRPARYTDEMNHITTAAYDGRGRVASYTYPEGDKEAFAYDSHNNTTELHRVPKPGCTGNCNEIVVTATWDQTWNKPATIVNARGYTANFTYFNSGNGKGLIQQVQLQAAHAGEDRPTYKFTYNSYGRVLTASTPITMDDDTFIITSNTYDSSNANLLTSTFDYGTGSHIAAVTTYAYDATFSQDVTRVTDPRGNASDTTYDLMRRKFTTLAHDGGGAANAIAATRTTYDLVGRVTTEEAGITFSGTSVSAWQVMKTIDYTPTGKPRKVVDADGQAGGPQVGAAVRTFYDALDRPLTVIDPALKQTHFVYCVVTDTNCAANAVRVEQRGWGSSDQIDYATYTYTLNGKQATVADADGSGHTTTFTYDPFDRLVRTTFPDPATPATYEEVAYYDTNGALCSANGSPCKRITRAGATISYTYDRLDRMETKAVPVTGGGTRTTAWEYDLGGRMESVVDNDNSIDPHYDTAGRTDWVARAVVGLTGTQTVSYQYDAAGNRTRITWPDSYYVSYGFDTLNRMTTASENGSFTLATYAYNALSRRTGLTYGNGATMSYTYTPAGDVTTLNHDMSGASNDPQFAFGYRPAHQLATQSISDNDYRWQASANTTDTYTHNTLDQYTTVAFNGQSLNNNGTNCQGQAQSFSYDCNGNTTRANYGTGNWWTYTYDAENRLTTATVSGTNASYLYDPLNHRTSKLVNSVYTFYLGDTGDDEIAEYDRDGSSNPVLLRRYVPGPAIDQPIAMVTAAGARTYFHTNRIGSVIAMSGDSAVKAEGPFTYDPYGFVCGGNGDSSCSLASGGVPYKFTGRRLDPETGLYYYRARYYTPILGRFLQTDPIGYQADLNLYAYVGNDPIDLTDPSGLCFGSRINAGGGSVCEDSNDDRSLSGSDAGREQRARNFREPQRAPTRTPTSGGGQGPKPGVPKGSWVYILLKSLGLIRDSYEEHTFITV